MLSAGCRSSANRYTAAHMRRALLILVNVLAGCLGDPCSTDEVARSPSPDVAWDAVLVENNCGATTSFSYVIHIVAHGQPFDALSRSASLYAAVRNDSAYGVTLIWKDPTHLSVEYLRAERATILSTALTNQIVVSLDSGIVDSNAPAGGMLRNLERRH